MTQIAWRPWSDEAFKEAQQQNRTHPGNGRADPIDERGARELRRDDRH